MAIWEDFELECTQYLNSNFGKYAQFIHQGGTDSTQPDILVKTVSGNTFYMDVKYSPAQCGQFVLLPNIQTNSFEYSSQNSNPMNDSASIIIKHMNESFDEFREAGTAGKDIVFHNNKEIFYRWIIEFYKEKNVKYFITNEYTIVPIDKFAAYFDVSAKYRIKRSGSSGLGKNRITAYAKWLLNDERKNYKITNIRVDGYKLFVSSDKELHNVRFKDDTYEYMFSARNNEYEVRKLSNTYHANVIFSIRYNNREGILEKDFIECLR